MRTVGLGAAENEKQSSEELIKKISRLEKENAGLKKEVDSLKKKAKASAEKKEKADPDTEPEKD